MHIILFVILFLFTGSCSTTEESGSENSKFKTLWKEPSSPPPQNALTPEGNTNSIPKKKSP